MTTINRRGFLQSLIALGAAIALPEKATRAQVDAVWEQVLKDPWFFEVNDAGTIVEPDGQEPRVNSDVYDIWVAHLKTPEDLIDEVDRYAELRGHFQSLAADELEDVELQLDSETLPKLQRRRLLTLRAALQDDDDGWQAWVRLGGLQALPRFKGEVDQWLDSSVNWGQSDFWPRGWSSQGRALTFFQQLDGDIVDALGVVIIEGEHPGSSYYAAELRMAIPEANEAAELLGLPFRFRDE
ncbi:MAG: hypothetical protein RL227_2347 [Pseudomonadota bacterium]